MKFLTNAAQEAAKDFVLKYKPLYCGLLLWKQLPGKLAVKPIDGQHVTTCFKPTDEQWVKCVFGGTQGHIRLIGYANDSTNEGISVYITGYNFYEGAKVPHVTLSCSKTGKAVDTAFLPFKPIDDGSKGWKKRLYEGTTVQWNFPPDKAFAVEATAFYGEGKTISIKTIQSECEEFIAENFPDEVKAQKAYKQMKNAQSALTQAEDRLRAAKDSAEYTQKIYQELIEELNKPLLVKEAEDALWEEHDSWSVNCDDLIITGYSNDKVFFKWEYSYPEGTDSGYYTSKEGIVYNKK